MIANLMSRFSIFLLIFMLCKSLYAQPHKEQLFKKANSFKNDHNYAEYYDELNSLLTKNISKENRAKVYRKKMEYFLVFNLQLDSVNSNYKKGVKLAKNLNNKELLANFEYLRGSEFTKRGEMADALQVFQNLELEMEEEEYSFLPHYYDAYARLLYQLGDIENAFRLLKKEAQIFKKRGEKENLSAVYNNLGILYKSRNLIDSSLYFHNKSQKINLELKDTLNVVRSYSNMGSTQLKSGQKEEAYENLEKAMEIAPENASQALKLNYVSILVEKGQKSESIKLLNEIIENPESVKIKLEALQKKADIYKIYGDFTSALSIQEKLNSESKKYLNEVKIKEIERLRTEYNVKKKEMEINQLQNMNDAQSELLFRNRMLVIAMILFFTLVIISGILYFFNKEQSRKITELTLQQKFLRAQMNPHFIFNALANIQTNILKEENEKAVNYLSQFARLIRSNLEYNFKNAISLSDELKSIKDYVDLQNTRLNNLLAYQVEIDEEID